MKQKREIGQRYTALKNAKGNKRNNMYYTTIKTDLSEIILMGDENGLSHLHLNAGKSKGQFKIDSKWIENRDFFSNIITQINDYFLGKRIQFDLKLNLQGTDYQKKVWHALMNIPYGETVTYKDIAIKIGNSNSARAVGMANNKNPIPLIIPCHRVIGSNGKMVGYAPGIDLKVKLLDLERRFK